MRYWKEHMALRAVLMAAFFVIGMILLIVGWKMTGQMSGLLLMLVGLVLILTALLLYNKPFEDEKKPKHKK